MTITIPTYVQEYLDTLRDDDETGESASFYECVLARAMRKGGLLYPSVYVLSCTWRDAKNTRHTRDLTADEKMIAKIMDACQEEYPTKKQFMEKLKEMTQS
jgi:hypothetical protein